MLGTVLSSKHGFYQVKLDGDGVVNCRWAVLSPADGDAPAAAQSDGELPAAAASYTPRSASPADVAAAEETGTQADELRGPKRPRTLGPGGAAGVHALPAPRSVEASRVRITSGAHAGREGVVLMMAHGYCQVRLDEPHAASAVAAAPVYAHAHYTLAGAQQPPAPGIAPDSAHSPLLAVGPRAGGRSGARAGGRVGGIADRNVVHARPAQLEALEAAESGDAECEQPAGPATGPCVPLIAAQPALLAPSAPLASANHRAAPPSSAAAAAAAPASSAAVGLLARDGRRLAADLGLVAF
ncbi:hypothetical protein T492DRAFT_1042788 [Pavlovales sp. CCMP2436]|nr:hypothetical protein T492DRAFT_1042788 [Pavlovales sp. CCMP2436]